MLYNIFKIGLVFWAVKMVWCGRTPQMATSVLEDFPADVNIQPFVKVGNTFYYFGQNQVSWYNAFLICRTLGGFLASYDSAQELADLSNYLISKYPLNYYWWLSGSDQDVEGKFFWYNTGEAIKYADWSAGQPDNMGGNEDCVHLWHLTKKYQMNDARCNMAMNYICQADKPTTIAVSIF
ncbi:C-type lectin 37Db-like [Lucilia sericata]|uniref:C-type lectin 37Db-like n=1 Tax=Lucilia sericata TaxID=13632 RepID=UPI0018A853E9|nr:C-type lectin 37Db-like [Lucilia sericata]